MTNLIELKKRIEQRRESLGYKTQREFAERAGISLSAYADYMKKGSSSRDTLIKMADALDVSIDYLVGRSDHLHVDDKEISKQIGLPEESIEILRNWNNAHGLSNLYGNQKLRTISVLIKNGSNVLVDLFEYLQIPDKGSVSIINYEQVEDLDEQGNLLNLEIIENVLASERFHDNLSIVAGGSNLILNADFVARSQLLQVDGSIRKMRDEIWEEHNAKTRKEGEKHGEH